MLAAYPVYVDSSSVRGAKPDVAIDGVVQEIDVKTGLLLFQWHSLDHVALTDSYTAPPKRNGPRSTSSTPTQSVWRPTGRSSRRPATRGPSTTSIIRQARSTGGWGASARVRARPGASFAWQHDVRVRSDHDRVLTLFDNGGGPPRAHDQSRGLKLALDLKHMTATCTAEYRHTPSLPANYEGNVQQLPNGQTFLGGVSSRTSPS